MGTGTSAILGRALAGPLNAILFSAQIAIVLQEPMPDNKVAAHKELDFPASAIP